MHGNKIALTSKQNCLQRLHYYIETMKTWRVSPDNCLQRLHYYIETTKKWRVSPNNWIWFIPTPVLPTGEAASFITISRSSLHVLIFCYINGIWICGTNGAINHSLCCRLLISKPYFHHRSLAFFIEIPDWLIRLLLDFLHVTPWFWPRCIKRTWCIYCNESWCGAKGKIPAIDLIVLCFGERNRCRWSIMVYDIY